MTGLIDVDKRIREKAEMLAALYMSRTDSISASSTPEDYVEVYNDAVRRITALLAALVKKDSGR